VIQSEVEETGVKVAVYVRVSRLDQHPENQLQELRRYVQARGWERVEFIEHGVSGAKDKRPQLDEMMAAVRRKRFDAVVCWKLDRLGRSMRHLVILLDELRALDVGLVTLGEGLDTTTPAGRMAFGIFAAVAEFERERLRERTLVGLDRARKVGKTLGRPVDATLRRRILAAEGMSVRAAARQVGCSTATIQKVRKLHAA
jgi:DNA invertase Pin-like site-specific DNA recombinase